MHALPLNFRKSIFANTISSCTMFLVAVLLLAGCKKSDNPDPCEGMLSEAPPLLIWMEVSDALTGKNVLLETTTTTIEIVSVPGSATIQGNINRQLNSPAYGMLVFPVRDSKEGAFDYLINLPGGQQLRLSHVNVMVPVDNPCRPYSIKVSDPVVATYPFTVDRAGSRILVRVTL